MCEYYYLCDFCQQEVGVIFQIGLWYGIVETNYDPGSDVSMKTCLSKHWSTLNLALSTLKLKLHILCSRLLSIGFIYS